MSSKTTCPPSAVRPRPGSGDISSASRDLTEKTKQFEGKEGNAVKSHLRNWISLLHDNPDMTIQKLERLKSMMPDTETGKKLLNMIKDDRL